LKSLNKAQRGLFCWFLFCSGIYAGLITAEGENYLMTQQTADVEAWCHLFFYSSFSFVFQENLWLGILNISSLLWS
jgi:hypothetical protein